MKGRDGQENMHVRCAGLGMELHLRKRRKRARKRIMIDSKECVRRECLSRECVRRGMIDWRDMLRLVGRENVDGRSVEDLGREQR